MEGIGHIVLSSLREIWHLIPIVIGILLFKKFINVRDRKNRVKKNAENEKNGFTLKKRTIKKYEELGYEVKEVEDAKGIDLVCSKENKTFIMQLNNVSDLKVVTGDDIEDFCDNAHRYMKTNEIDKKTTEFRYVVPYMDVLQKTAFQVFSDDSYKCKYVVL